MTPDLLRQTLTALREARAKLEAADRREHEPIAIVGMGCRFPRANSPEAFWQLLRDGVDAVSEIPSWRWDVGASYSTGREDRARMYTRYIASLDEVATFDADFFGISPREANALDPQQRLLLEVCWEALEYGGIAPAQLRRTRTGVYIGKCTADYRALAAGDPATHEDHHAFVGNMDNMAAGRIAWTLGAHGPAVELDTACSSSLVAVHLAVASLRSRESDLALAGGVNLILTPDDMIALCRVNALSPDGRCRTFDAAADGYGRGEGCGVVVLKRLSDAQADGDNILALIRGTAVNHDGPSSGLTAPNGPAQEQLLRQALRNARIEPGAVGYVEAHGTGTQLGDPIEMGALNAVFGGDRDPLWVGSVKTNIGHLEAAAGIAALIKTVLALGRGEIPAHLHFRKPNPLIDWERSRVRVPVKTVEWTPAGGALKRVAGVSSFGFSGTNAHLILEEADAQAPPSPRDAGAHILVLSAKTDAALREMAGNHSEFLRRSDSAALGDVCRTAAIGRNHLERRLAFVAESEEEMVEALASALSATPSGASATPPRTAFLFAGEGANFDLWHELYRTEPRFRREMDRCYEILGASLPGQPEVTRPGLFALEYALAELWRSWGIEPDFVSGEGVGELAAACVAGLFSLEDGLKLASAAQTPEFRRIAAKIAYRPAAVRLISSATGRVAGSEVETAEYWTGQVRDAARYADRMREARNLGADILLEIGITDRRATLESLASLYRAGANVDWRGFYNGRKSRRTILPTYPFQRRRHWVQAPSQRSPAESLRPLIDRQMRLPRQNQVVFEKSYSLAALPFLRDHLVYGEFVTPGALHLSLALSAAELLHGPSRCEIRDVVFPQALVLGRDETRTLQIIVDDPSGAAQFRVLSFGSEAEAITHATGKIERRPRTDEHSGTIESAIVSGDAQPATYAYGLLAARRVELGERFQWIDALWLNGFEAVARLRQPRGLFGIKAYRMFPGLVDACFQVAGIAHFYATQGERKTVLPFALGSLSFFAAPEEECELWCRVSRVDDNAWDIWLSTASGEPIAGMRRFEMNEVPEAAIQRSRLRTDWLYSPAWIARPHRAAASGTPGAWLVVGGKAALAESLGAQSVSPAELRLAVAAYSSLAVIWIAGEWSGLLEVAKTLAGAQSDIRLFVVTKNGETDPEHGAIRGLARTIAVENPRLGCRIVDVDDATPDAVIRDELVRGSERQVAYRGATRFVACLQPFAGAHTAEKTVIDPGGSFLVTGGLGALGLTIAEQLVEDGARSLVLNSRSGIAAKDARERIAALEAKGAQVQIVAADVCERAGVGRLIDACEKMAPLKGVVHTAGILDDGVLGSQSAERFKKVMAPKATGASLLDEMTRDKTMAFFVCFSSAASLIGSAGQSNYASANGFIDALMRRRHREGLPGLAINWGPWADAGMATAVRRSSMHRGVDGIPAAQGRRLFSYLLRQNVAQIGVLALNAEFESDLLETERNSKPAGFRTTLETTSPDSRLQTTISWLQRETARILGSAERPSAHRAFADLGMDSLMGLELRNCLQDGLAISLPATLLFRYTNIAELAGFLAGRVTGGPASPEVEARRLPEPDQCCGEDAAWKEVRELSLLLED